MLQIPAKRQDAASKRSGLAFVLRSIDKEARKEGGLRMSLITSAGFDKAGCSFLRSLAFLIPGPVERQCLKIVSHKRAMIAGRYGLRKCASLARSIHTTLHALSLPAAHQWIACRSVYSMHYLLNREVDMLYLKLFDTCSRQRSWYSWKRSIAVENLLVL